MQAVDELDDCRVMFGYVRCIMPDGRPKFVAITWVGMSAPEHQKGKVSSYKGQIEAFLDPNHLHVMAREEDDIDEVRWTYFSGVSFQNDANSLVIPVPC